MSAEEDKTFLDYRILGLLGSILIIVSEFIPWLSSFTLINIYLLSLGADVLSAYLYLFPLISGVICLMGNLIILKRPNFKLNSVIINIIGLSFLLLFFFYFIPNEILYLTDAGIGFYCCFTGFILVIIDIMTILVVKE